ncbi:MAG: putative thiamine transport system substrate-binding protein, partial [Cognaticolwellia sp.]
MPLGNPHYSSNRCLSRQKSLFSTPLATRLFQPYLYQSVIGFAIMFIALLSTTSLSYANSTPINVSTIGASTKTEIKASTEAQADKNKTINIVTDAEISNNASTQAQWLIVENRAKNNAVYFHAWGADPQINSYIQWLAKRVKQEYSIDLRHVKLTDTSEAVSRVLAEKSANNHQQGQVDLVWINGENFASMAKYQLLAQGWVSQLPNFWLTNPSENEAMTRDFGLPTQGMEAPWGQASLTFYYTPSINVNKPINTYQDSIRHAPKNISQLLTWAKQNPGRFTYPKPPDFLSL